MMEDHHGQFKLSTLCFKKEDFIVGDFNVDQFVGQCRKYVSLETMLEDLGTYHKILCSSMVELINKDYVDFVNLSSNLVGLDKSIKSLSSPLHSLKTEISNLKHSLDETTESACKMISERNSVHEEKILTHRIVCVLEGLEKIDLLWKAIPNDNQKEINKGLSLDVLERIALEYNLVQFHMDKMSNLNILHDKKEVVNQVENSLQNHLECLFLLGLTNNDPASVRKVLQIFSALNKERHAEAFFCDAVVKPHISLIVTEEMISKYGLAKVFDDVLKFIREHCALILDVTRGVKKNYEYVTGYDFLVNAVFLEIINNLDYIAPVYVFDHGNPEVFYKNYCACMSFLDDFEFCLAVQASVKRLHKHSSYKTLMKKWNLDVYFQIRFQEIAKVFESSLLCPFIKPPNDGNEKLYILNVTFTLWFCLNRCWSKGVFLRPLIHNFWRLSIQLISRYTTWAKSMIYKEKNCDELPHQVELQELKPKHNKVGNQENNSSSANTNPSILHWASLIKDTELLLSEIELLFNENISQKLGGSAHSVKDAFQESKGCLKDVLVQIAHHIVKVLVSQCSLHLNLINDIPRLYRKTNREVPSKPSLYVTSLLTPLEEFQCDTEPILPKEWKTFCLKETVSGIAEMCTKIIRDVLTSIKKMEDSLKILKRARDKPNTGQAASGNMTDDDKMRRQLVIDVSYICKKVESLGLNCEGIKSYRELQDLVSSAERNTVDAKSSPR